MTAKTLGLYANIQAKQAHIANGNAKHMNKSSIEDAPSLKDLRDVAKASKKAFQ